MYPTTAELIAGSTVTELTGLTADQQDALRQEAIDAIEGFCHQSFEPEGTEAEPVTRTIDGTGSRVLYLPQRLVSLTGLSVAGGGFTDADVALSDRRDHLRIPQESDGSTWATRAVAEITGSREALFPAGPGTVEVTGIWGWADAEYPEQVTTALRWDMEDRALANAHALADTARSARALGIGSVDQGGLSLSLDRAEPEVSSRVKRALRGGQLVWSPVAGALA